MNQRRLSRTLNVLEAEPRYERDVARNQRKYAR
jgi:hypothetical protein